jgi:hypothetical protein
MEQTEKMADTDEYKTTVLARLSRDIATSSVVETGDTSNDMGKIYDIITLHETILIVVKEGFIARVMNSTDNAFMFISDVLAKCHEIMTLKAMVSLNLYRSYLRLLSRRK